MITSIAQWMTMRIGINTPFPLSFIFFRLERRTKYELGGIDYMREVFIHGTSLAAAYHDALLDLWHDGEDTECPDWNTNQLELSLTFTIDNALTEPMISKLFIGGPHELEQYRQEMLDGILDFEIDKGNWTYTYHDRYKDQYKFVVEELKRNPYSRRAVMDIRTRDDMNSFDPACLQHIQYFIRDDRLHCKVLFRSNDACKATFMNAFALIMLQKRIADELGVKVGSYTHRANSFHCYEKDLNTLNIYSNYILNRPLETLSYSYVGEWKELMEAEQEAIQKKVESLERMA